ncbi:helix-turn-helix domain-containing protein [Microbulbifer litoralis]|uniref:helix-turn-helix domain-containing protein n=1 Tax=Microbulbifer litoralis TaxID=2933965 RepID=UPI002027E754|nr:helix-turn-helix transcriptional regulator [Microbulbifer sp. GX H0434]
MTERVETQQGSLSVEIGNHIRQLRLAANISQEELAAASGVGLSTLKRLERGAGCNLAALLQLLESLGCADRLGAFFAGLVAEARSGGAVGERRRASSARRPEPAAE